MSQPASYREAADTYLFRRTLINDPEWWDDDDVPGGDPNQTEDELWSDDENAIIRDWRPVRNRLRPIEENAWNIENSIRQSAEARQQFPEEPQQGGPIDDGEDGAPFGICTICTTNPVDRCIVPCGHTNACNECITFWIGIAEEPTCPKCRRVIQETVKIFK